MTNGDDVMSGQTVYDNDGKAVGQMGGLTKREYFAAMAIPGMKEARTEQELIDNAEWAVKQADALIAALNEPQEAK